MPISEKDRDFMEKVAEYFCSTMLPKEPNGSIRDTALKFAINRNKVRKILITMGELESPVTKEAVLLRDRGMSIKEIAETLGVSVATVSTALPYTDKIDNTLEPSDHALDVRNYRAYEREQLKRQAGRGVSKRDPAAIWKGVIMEDQKTMVKEWQKDIKMSYTEAYHRPHRDTWEDIDTMSKMGETLQPELQEEIKEPLFKEGIFPGALNDRSRKVLEEIAGDRLLPQPMRVLRLHMELYDEYSDDETKEVLKKYGLLKYGDCISRDVIVPGDIPLYALHYVIQRAFGWQNSHMRQYEIPEDRFQALCNHNASMWSRMVGILFRSPLMDEADEFWADDYNGGSFKNWLRKKYTGPYLSQCHGEGIVSCLEDMMRLDMEEEHYLLYARAYNYKTEKYDGEEYLSRVSPVYDREGKKRPEPKPWHGGEVPYRVEVVKFEAIPPEGLKYLFERNPMALLERLPIHSVLAAGRLELPDGCSKEERSYIDGQMARSGDEVYEYVEKFIRRITKEQIDSPEMQVYPMPFTDVLLYHYDFGDDWKVRITASENCPDLVESGRITQAELDRANVKCREVYRPVLIARDGEMLLDDVGGLHGFIDFLRKINPELEGLDREEKADARQEKKEYLTWAKSLGWHKDNSVDFNLL